ncbi:MAG: hypothetical protein B6D47_12940 [Rhodocyclaceae bacterium UTPRO2]|jgi:hypothetical protein|nr:MAG: hypothetical protein B6D47_12940 [Rhodocyclaceae bacterium UTPRO2]
MTESEFKEMEARLENWRLCVRVGLVRHHCASVEHRYRPGGLGADARRAPKLLVDELDGWRVEEAWRALPVRFRFQLNLHYVRCVQQHQVIRWVLKRTAHSIKPWHYKAELFYAVGLLKKKLDSMNSRSHNRGHNSSSVSIDTSRESPKAGAARPEETKPVSA